LDSARQEQARARSLSNPEPVTEFIAKESDEVQWEVSPSSQEQVLLLAPDCIIAIKSFPPSISLISDLNQIHLACVVIGCRIQECLDELLL